MYISAAAHHLKHTQQTFKSALWIHDSHTGRSPVAPTHSPQSSSSSRSIFPLHRTHSIAKLIRSNPPLYKQHVVADHPRDGQWAAELAHGGDKHRDGKLAPDAPHH